jgi:hypothetical protein
MFILTLSYRQREFKLPYYGDAGQTLTTGFNGLTVAKMMHKTLNCA